MLIDKNLNVQVVNFGLGVCHNVSNLTFQAVLDSFSAPELWEGRNYNGFQVDIFAVGAVAFAITKGCLPFTKATLPDRFWKLINNQDDGYWLATGSESNSTLFKDIIMAMLQRCPEKRAQLPYLLKHPWLFHSFELSHL